MACLEENLEDGNLEEGRLACLEDRQMAQEDAQMREGPLYSRKDNEINCTRCMHRIVTYLEGGHPCLVRRAFPDQVQGGSVQTRSSQ